ncbi:hypothetical protein WH50_13720 [Pokkaliibacter plantistimulans]|uniref:Uncharacterized protein n=2 Tax=Pseudomonadota TaxID=1224 RepID=A0ABX5LWT3_9GAMM|nr:MULTISPECIES: hypothetical protein [Pokkaliibacter]MDH2433432.1 hypothetical protein [Pokkaliibacter sp. MBI-7]PPC78242.1 hypothetical protein C4K68_06310 [Pokkaliibacter plantistimulans]PXF30662.1 hypothetical protein WH50_13720 [Pokkaliibacter plantistimulans]
MYKPTALSLTVLVLVVTCVLALDSMHDGLTGPYGTALAMSWLMVGNWQGYHRIRRNAPQGMLCWASWLLTISKGPLNARKLFRPEG